MELGGLLVGGDAHAAGAGLVRRPPARLLQPAAQPLVGRLQLGRAGQDGQRLPVELPVEEGLARRGCRRRGCPGRGRWRRRTGPAPPAGRPAPPAPGPRSPGPGSRRGGAPGRSGRSSMARRASPRSSSALASSTKIRERGSAAKICSYFSMRVGAICRAYRRQGSYHGPPDRRCTAPVRRRGPMSAPVSAGARPGADEGSAPTRPKENGGGPEASAASSVLFAARLLDVVRAAHVGLAVGVDDAPGDGAAGR